MPAIGRIALLSAAFAFLAPASSRLPAEQPDAAFEQLSALITQKMSEYSVPGVAFGIVKAGRATVRGFGVTNVDEPLPITPDTIFPVASISKTVTATAIMRLVEQGKLDLEAPVQRYLPGFRVQDERASREVAIWHLLTHTPGWEGQLNSPDRGTETFASRSTTRSGRSCSSRSAWRERSPGSRTSRRIGSRWRTTARIHRSR
jgi:CubicO group peptidase (beta-lactamase class C family)